jgi:hypothetical protein
MAEQRVQRRARERLYAFGRLLTCVQCSAVMRVTTGAVRSRRRESG